MNSFSLQLDALKQELSAMGNLTRYTPLEEPHQGLLVVHLKSTREVIEEQEHIITFTFTEAMYEEAQVVMRIVKKYFISVEHFSMSLSLQGESLLHINLDLIEERKARIKSLMDL